MAPGLKKCTEEDLAFAGVSMQMLKKPFICENLNSGLPDAFMRLLSLRGLKEDNEIARFLSPSKEDLHDPYMLMDMAFAVERISSAMKMGEKILIYGDYDADGVTSTALLKLYLEQRGAVTCTYIPNRLTEGYGLNCEVIDRFAKEEGIGLIITVDTGSTAVLEIAYALSMGIDTVVTDHHECLEELPKCAALVNPVRPGCPYPFKGLAGVGVVFKLICALENCIGGKENNEKSPDELLSLYGDLVALGSIADVMPMLDENRYIVKKGLKLMEEGANAGLAALLEKIGAHGKTFTSATAGYSVAPHINAAGRMGHAEHALELLLCKKIGEARVLASLLCEYNLMRKNEEQCILREAEEMIHVCGYENDRVLVLGSENWHPGVLGIVAAKITEKYNKPSFLISFSGEEGKGSGRGVAGVDLVALLSKVKEHTVKFGGHEMAAGLTVKKDQLPMLRQAMLDAVKDAEEEVPSLDTQKRGEMTLSPLDLSLPFASALELLEPFGEGNPLPLFLLEHAEIENITPLSMGKHTKLLIQKENLLFTCLMFSQKTALFPYVEGDRVDLVFEISINEYMHKKSVQLLVRKVYPAGKAALDFKKGEAALDSLKKSRTFDVKIPQRRDFASVYTNLRALQNAGEDSFSWRILSMKSGCDSLAQCMLILMVFEEQGLLVLRGNESNKDLFYFNLPPAEKKADLEKSVLLNRFVCAAGRQ